MRCIKHGKADHCLDVPVSCTLLPISLVIPDEKAKAPRSQIKRLEGLGLEAKRID
jgi:hypothetical protein